MWRRKHSAHCGKPHRSYHRRLGFEQFEPRQMMAVTTSIADGTLTVTGDAAADDIAIVGTARAGELTITGRNGTTINGSANGSVTIPGVRGSLIINIDAGDDVLSLDNVYIAGSITITSGDGNDLVTLGAAGVVSPALYLSINSGSGNDQVYELNYSVFVGDWNLIELGPGDDWASLIGASANGGSYGRAFGPPTVPSISVEGQDGHDSILGVGLTARLALRLNGDIGTNSLALLDSAAHSIGVSSRHDPSNQAVIGATTIYVDTNYAVTAIGVHTNGGSANGPFTDSSVRVYRCLCSVLDVGVGQGNNFVYVYGNAVNGPPYMIIGGETGGVHPALIITVGRSTNGAPHQNQSTVLVSYNLGIRATVWLGDGDDSLALIGNLMTDTTTLDGFGGQDHLFLQANSLGNLTTVNFDS
jgi:hypothetical protein